MRLLLYEPGPGPSISPSAFKEIRDAFGNLISGFDIIFVKAELVSYLSGPGRVNLNEGLLDKVPS
jgi:hypothetical protein